LPAVQSCIVSLALALLKERTRLKKCQQWKPPEKTTEIFSLNTFTPRWNKKVHYYSSLVRQIGRNLGSYPQAVHRVIPRGEGGEAATILGGRSLVPLELPFAPVGLFALGIEHPPDIPVQRLAASRY
jgi:hypothetical protein